MVVYCALPVCVWASWLACLRFTSPAYPETTTTRRLLVGSIIRFAPLVRTTKRRRLHCRIDWRLVQQVSVRPSVYWRKLVHAREERSPLSQSLRYRASRTIETLIVHARWVYERMQRAQNVALHYDCVRLLHRAVCIVAALRTRRSRGCFMHRRHTIVRFVATDTSKWLQLVGYSISSNSSSSLTMDSK